MVWIPVLGDDRQQATHHDGRPLWQCHTGKHKLRGHHPKGDCGCLREPLRLNSPAASRAPLTDRRWRQVHSAGYAL